MSDAGIVIAEVLLANVQNPKSWLSGAQTANLAVEPSGAVTFQGSGSINIGHLAELAMLALEDAGYAITKPSLEYQIGPAGWQDFDGFDSYETRDLANQALQLENEPELRLLQRRKAGTWIVATEMPQALAAEVEAGRG